MLILSYFSLVYNKITRSDTINYVIYTPLHLAALFYFGSLSNKLLNNKSQNCSATVCVCLQPKPLGRFLNVFTRISEKYLEVSSLMLTNIHLTWNLSRFVVSECKHITVNNKMKRLLIWILVNWYFIHSVWCVCVFFHLLARQPQWKP